MTENYAGSLCPSR